MHFKKDLVVKWHVNKILKLVQSFQCELKNKPKNSMRCSPLLYTNMLNVPV